MAGPVRLTREFYTGGVLEVAPGLIGKDIIICRSNGMLSRYEITEVEAYRGAEDLACHASKGRTGRTDIMYHAGGRVYMYLIYGMYWMMNVVAGEANNPQAALIRGITGFNGPGKLTRALGIDGSYYGEDLVTSERIWIEDCQRKYYIISGPRIGIDYAGEPWVTMPWRYSH